MVQAFKKDECIVDGVSYNKPGECGQAQQALRDQQQVVMKGGDRRKKPSKQQIATNMKKLSGVINEILGSRKCFNKTSGTCNGTIVRRSVQELVEKKLQKDTVQVNVKKQKVMRHGATKSQVDEIIKIIDGRVQRNPYATTFSSDSSITPRTMSRSRSRSRGRTRPRSVRRSPVGTIRMTPPAPPLRTPPPRPLRSFERSPAPPPTPSRRLKKNRKTMKKSPKKFNEASYVRAVHNRHARRSPRKSSRKSVKKSVNKIPKTTLTLRQQLEKARKAADRPVTPGYEQLIGMMDKRQGMFPEGGGNKKRRRTRRKRMSKKRNSTRRRQHGGKQESVSHQAIANTTGDTKGADTAKGLEDLSAQVKYNNA